MEIESKLCESVAVLLSDIQKPYTGTYCVRKSTYANICYPLSVSSASSWFSGSATCHFRSLR